MRHPDFIGTDRRIQRQLFVLGAANVDELLTGFRLSDEPFTCLLIWDSGMESEDSVHAVASLLTGASCRWICVFGDDRSRVRGCIADALEGAESPASPEPGIAVQSGDSLDQCLTTFLQTSALDPQGRTDCRYGIAIVIGGNRERLQYVRAALTDHVDANHVASPPPGSAAQVGTSAAGGAPRHRRPSLGSGGFQGHEEVRDEGHAESMEGREWKHSRFGIASFVISLTLGVGVLLGLVALAVKYMEDESFPDEDSPWLMLVAVGFLGSIFGNFLALALGLAGLREKRRKKTFAVLGTVFSGLSLFLFILFIVIGALTE